MLRTRWVHRVLSPDVLTGGARACGYLTAPCHGRQSWTTTLQALLEQLGANAPLIQGFRAEGFSVDFSCGLFLDSDNEGLRIAPETLARVATLGAALDLDIYALFEDDEPATRAPDASL